MHVKETSKKRALDHSKSEVHINISTGSASLLV